VAEHPDRVIADIAAEQHNRVSRAQLLARGVTRDEIRSRLRSGHLHGVARGVYAVGSPAPSLRAGQMTALLVRGAGSALTHVSGSAVWTMLAQDAPPHHVSGPSSGSRFIGVIAHRARFAPGDVAVHDGLRVASPMRCLLDLAETESVETVARALAEAEVLQLVTRPALLERLPVWRGRHGVRVLRELIDDNLAPAPTRSVLEERFLALVRRAGLPRPLVNVKVAGWLVDAYWPRHRIVVELDGRRFHDTASRFEHDRARSAALVAAGELVMQFTWRRLDREDVKVVAELAAALAQREREADALGRSAAA
jgi:hypothetical protein